jgi:hypothetical protein
MKANNLRASWCITIYNQPNQDCPSVVHRLCIPPQLVDENREINTANAIKRPHLHLSQMIVFHAATHPAVLSSDVPIPGSRATALLVATAVAEGGCEVEVGGILDGRAEVDGVANEIAFVSSRDAGGLQTFSPMLGKLRNSGVAY